MHYICSDLSWQSAFTCVDGECDTVQARCIGLQVKKRSAVVFAMQSLNESRFRRLALPGMQRRWQDGTRAFVSRSPSCYVANALMHAKWRWHVAMLDLDPCLTSDVAASVPRLWQSFGYCL